ncbi:hypothetical protein L6452_14919 [Arctium lappa]|uniref:Uncharacterized protein n=1 Tax=Arctium lappa TaxID=4217 RepID=A0ACB9CMM0_ARCLA|nr:hypothetical protein L6452_14919 [Arctium lappa]
MLPIDFPHRHSHLLQVVCNIIHLRFSIKLIPPLVNMSGPLMAVQTLAGNLRSRHISRDSGDYLIDTPNSEADGLRSVGGTHGVRLSVLPNCTRPYRCGLHSGR